jgi:uncharacterized protein (TIGR00661 family)
LLRNWTFLKQELAMRFLFVVQGEGRGHLTQAIALREILTNNNHEVVAVLVGKSNRRELPSFFLQNIQSEVLRFDSPNFLPASKKNQTKIWRSIVYNLCKSVTYLRSIHFIRKQIKHLNVDIVVNFYEFLTGLTYSLFPPNVPYISVAHQYILLHPEFQFPQDSKVKLWMLRFFTRITCIRASKILALSIKKMDNVPKSRLVVVPPLLRKNIFDAKVSDGDYLHGYMLNDTYSDEIIRFQKEQPDVDMIFFWDRKGVEEKTVINERLSFFRLNDQLFIDYMAGCKAYITTAGFESVCEALYMGKPVMMIPTHIEQACNAYEASLAGAGIVSEDFNPDNLLKYIPQYQKNTSFREWVQQAQNYILKEL